MLLLERRVEEAALTVMLPPSATLVLLIVTEEFASWLFPMVEVETKDVPLKLRSWPWVYEVALLPPFAMESALPRFRDPMEAVCAKRFVLDAVVEKKLVLVALAKVVLPLKELVPLKVLLFESNVELAAEIVILPPSESDVPFTVPRMPVR